MPDAPDAGFPTIPDSMTPVLGVRRILVPSEQVRKGIEFSKIKPVLKMGRGGKCFRPGEAARAACVRSPAIVGEPHESPLAECTCGIYAWNRLVPPLPRWVNHPLMMVIGWGRVFHGENYWRAQYAKPVALLPLPEEIWWLNLNYIDVQMKQRIYQTLEEWQARVACEYDLPVLSGEELSDHAKEFGVWPTESKEERQG